MSKKLKFVPLMFGLLMWGGHSYANGQLVEVWKNPSCGCCNDWIDHMKQNGFEVKIHNDGNDHAHQKFGIHPQYGSCHTAMVDGYVIEGHVPAEDVKRLLAEKPNSLGLSVPGMPIGSPGMDGEVYQGRHQAYDVLLLDKQGGHQVFSVASSTKPPPRPTRNASTSR